MKYFKKNLKQKLVMLVLLLFASSCGDDDFETIDESSQTPATTTIYVPNNLFSNAYCDDFSENGTKTFNVVINVDVYSNGEFQENTYNEVFTIENDTYDFVFDGIEVPETGSYVVSISFNGANDCFSCCSSSQTCTYIDNYGTQWSGGHPYFRGIKMLRDQTDVPPYINISPTKFCF